MANESFETRPVVRIPRGIDIITPSSPLESIGYGDQLTKDGGTAHYGSFRAGRIEYDTHFAICTPSLPGLEQCQALALVERNPELFISLEGYHITCYRFGMPAYPIIPASVLPSIICDHAQSSLQELVDDGHPRRVFRQLQAALSLTHKLWPDTTRDLLSDSLIKKIIDLPPSRLAEPRPPPSASPGKKRSFEQIGLARPSGGEESYRRAGFSHATASSTGSTSITDLLTTTTPPSPKKRRLNSLSTIPEHNESLVPAPLVIATPPSPAPVEAKDQDAFETSMSLRTHSASSI
ncbi:hypothetical protein RQP46_005206 [Phenoliferia psychrophenolica]